MVRIAYTGQEPVAGEIIRAAETAMLKHEGGAGIRKRVDALVKRYRKQSSGRIAFIASSAERERARLTRRMDVLIQRSAPDEWISRVWMEIHALDLAAELLLKRAQETA